MGDFVTVASEIQIRVGISAFIAKLDSTQKQRAQRVPQNRTPFPGLITSEIKFYSIKNP